MPAAGCEFDQPGGAESADVLGHGCVGQLKGRREIAGRTRPRPQQVEHAPANGVRNSAKHIRGIERPSHISYYA